MEKQADGSGNMHGDDRAGWWRPPPGKHPTYEIKDGRLRMGVCHENALVIGALLFVFSYKEPRDCIVEDDSWLPMYPGFLLCLPGWCLLAALWSMRGRRAERQMSGIGNWKFEIGNLRLEMEGDERRGDGRGRLKRFERGMTDFLLAWFGSMVRMRGRFVITFGPLLVT